MKFSATNIAEAKTFHIDKLNGGIDLDLSGHSGDETCLAECKNVWFNGGILKSRPGLFATPENLLYNEAYGGGYYHYYRIANTEITAAGEPKSIIVEEINYSDSSYACLTHIINCDGTLWNTAEMTFSRSSDSVFYIPGNIVFFKGAPQNGAGLFAFVNLVNVENFSQKISHIYEMNTEFSAWKLAIDTYIPTVLINGRGNNYEVSAATNQAFTGTPTKLERLNLLNSTFHAYYSTDGHSSSFRLPFSNLADDTVSCRFYYKLNAYIEWEIPQGKTSAEASFNDVKVTMNVDRAKGIVYFTVQAGDYSIPLMTHQNENNLRFTAVKNSDYGLNDVTASTLSVSVNGKIILANKNILFEADYNNPLYFPSDSVSTVGEADSGVTAFATLKDEIIAFKPNETYFVNVKNGKALNSVSLLADNDSVFYAGDTLNAECISSKTGCPDKNSVIELDRQLFWRGADGYIYSLNSLKQIFCVSQKINSFIDGNISPTAYTYGVRYGNYNTFIVDNCAIVMECTSENLNSGDGVRWYYWDFPDNLRISGTFSITGKSWILCCNTENNLCFIATLSGETDTLIYGDIYEPEITKIPIKSVIHTKKLSLGCDNTFKKIESVILQLKSKRATVRLNGRLEAQICRHETDVSNKAVRLTPGLCGVEAVDISIESDTGLDLGSIDIKYTELGL